MTPQLFANMLVTVKGDDDLVLLDAAISALAPVVDGVIFLDTTPKQFQERTQVRRMLESCARGKPDSWLQYEYNPDIVLERGFGQARNKLLRQSPDNAYLLWVDSDEIHFTEQLLALRRAVLVTNTYDDISLSFVHFCLGSNFYEKIESRIRIFRKTPGMHWEGRAHEKLCYGIERTDRKVFYSDYVFHHYGYLRSQDYIRDRWDLYNYLQEEPARQIPLSLDNAKSKFYDRETKARATILDTRRESLIPYFGDYPAAIPREWIESKRIQF